MSKVFSYGWKALKVLILLIIATLLVVILSIPMSRMNSPQLNLLADWSARLSQSQLITNVHLVDVRNGRTITGQAVLIEKGLVSRIDQVEIILTEIDDLDVVQIDGGGLFLIPGLVDAHVHLFDPKDLGLYLSHGITTVRNMAGMPAHLRWQEEIEQQGLIASRLISYSPALNAGDNLGPFHQRVESPEHGRYLVRKFSEMGYQGIKIYNGLSLEMTNAIIDEASSLDLPVAGHPSGQYPFEQALSLPLASIEHIEELFQIGLRYQATQASVAQLAEQVADSDMPIVSTLVAFDNILQASEAGEEFLNEVDWNYLTGFTAFVGQKQLGPQLAGQAGDWESQKTRAHFAITRALFENGATVAIGTDTGPVLTMPGLSFHRELEILSELEVSNLEILKAATLNSSKVMHETDVCGEIRVGCFADLILVRENPLEDISTLREPEAVFIEGKHLSRQLLLELREQGQDHHSFYTVLGWLLESLMQ